MYTHDFCADMITGFCHLSKKYGDIYRLWLGPQPFVGIFSPEHVEVSQSCQKFVLVGGQTAV